MREEGSIEVANFYAPRVEPLKEGVDLLKLDCEGSEAGILESLAEAELLGGVTFIRGEYHTGDYARRVVAALAATHLPVTHGGEGLGFFCATPRGAA